jgi:protein-disulfide isomerase
MDKRFWGILSILAVIIVVAIVISDHKNNTNGGTNLNVKPTEHVEGQGTSGVTLVEYGDYECPVCGAYYSPLKQIAAEYATQIHFQFRNLPLTSIHPNAFAGARAAEAAALQAKFWQMHDELYANQNQWANSSSPTTFFKQYAQALGLNVSKFENDMNSDQVNNAINGDVAYFQKNGPSWGAPVGEKEGTPTLILDGKYINLGNVVDTNGQPSVQRFEAILNAEIASKK